MQMIRVKQYLRGLAGSPTRKDTVVGSTVQDDHFQIKSCYWVAWLGFFWIVDGRLFSWQYHITLRRNPVRHGAIVY
jgi:hypothetical protein